MPGHPIQCTLDPSQAQDDSSVRELKGAISWTNILLDRCQWSQHWQLQLSAQTGNVVKYHAGINDVKYLYGVADPAARLKPGDILDTNTLDCFGNALKKPGDTLSMAKGDNPLTGPFYIEGAQPGDTLAVKIIDLQVDGDTG